jgi:hypothetical protein
MNNCEPLSLTDWHAEQLQEQLRRIRQTKKKIKRYAIIGTDASLGQSLNVYHLQKDVEIHVFEQNIKSIECASFTAEKMGLGGVFNFHHGDAAIELPKVAKQIGEFDMLEMMLVLQHLRGDSFRIFLEGVLSALKTGGLLKINELMIRTLGSVKIHDNSAEVSSLSAEKIIGKYFRGDDNLQTPSFLRVGWDWPKGHAWFNGGEMIKDIFSCTDKRLALRDEFTLSLPEGEFFYGDPLRWTGYRYVIVSLAAAMAAQANSLKSVSGQEAAAERVARLAAWAFEDGWKVDNLLTSNAFKERKFSVNFSEVVGVILEKTA